MASCIQSVGGLDFDQINKIFNANFSSWSTVLGDYGREECSSLSGFPIPYKPDDNGGTLQFFCDEIFADIDVEGDCNTTGGIYFNANIQAQENDDDIINGVRGQSFGIGFVGFGHFIRNSDGLYAIPIRYNNSNNNLTSFFEP